MTRFSRAPAFGSFFVCLSLLLSSAFTLNEDLRVVGDIHVRLSLFDLFKQAEFCQDAVYSRTSFRHLESGKYRGKRFLSSRLCYYSNAVSGYHLTRIVFAGDVSPNPGPVTRRSNATENLLLSAFSTIKHHGRCDITVGHTNARGLHKNLPQVKFLLFHTGLDVLAVSETHLSPAVESYEIAIQGYQLQRKDRLGKIGGGVAVYFKDSLDCISIAKYDNCDIEATWLELKVKSQRLLVGCIYRPPDSEGFYDKFLPILERISANRKNVIITGDFNSNMLDNSGNGKKFKDVLQLVNFKNVIKNPTRVTEHSSTIIDLICTNNMPKVNSAGVIDFCIADHKFIYISFKLAKSRNSLPVIKQVKNFKGVKEDPKSLQNDLETAPWWICSIFDEIDDVTWAWETMFKDVVDSHVTKRLVKIRQHSLPWMNSEIRKAMNKRYKLLKLCDGTPNTNQYWEEYKSARNQVTALLRSAETQYWKERFDKANNSSMFWKTVHSISGSQKSSRIGPVKDENSLEVLDDGMKADLFNQYFVNIGRDVAENLVTIPNQSDIQHIYRVSAPSCNSLVLDFENIFKSLKNIKSNKAAGPDGISSTIISLAGPAIIHGLENIFKRSFVTRTVPTSWKRAKVTPIFKKGARTDIANYRPISLLCIPSKLLEHQVCNIIDEHLSNSSLKSSSQWGFTKGLSSEGMLLKMTDTWKMNMDKGMIVGAIFVDFKKAFDSISHNILSLKLQAIGLSGNLHEWLMDYLKHRFQYTVVNGHPSNLDEVKYGVPQGSLLGPRLYTIYVNDLPNAITSGDVFMYADDTTLYCVGKNFDQVCSQLNNILEQLLLWSTMNKLCIHPVKSEVMILSKTSFIGPVPPIHFGNNFINVVNHTTCLGLIIDNRLTWAMHVDHVKKSFAQKVGALKRMKKLPVKVLEEIYFKSIVPAVSYGIVVWGNCNYSIMESLNPIHARAARVIHQDKSLEKLNWLPISYIYKRRLLLLMHDVLNDKILYPPFNLRLGNRPSRTGGLQVEIPRVNYKVGKESAQYRGPVIWNFIARLANFNVNIQKDSFKNILRRLSQNINSFLFEAPMIAMKDRDFVYF